MGRKTNHSTLLGGLSYFAPDLGFACDNVANFEVVLASGEVVNANAQSHPDLYRALKGGQSNFGIITRFDLVTTSRNTMWGGGIAFPISTEDASSLKPFTEIQPQLRNSMRIDTVRSFAEELQRVQPKEQYALYVTTTFYITSTISKKINEIWKTYSLKMSDVSNILSVITYQQFPPRFKKSPNAMDFDPDDESNKKLMILIVSIYWPNRDGYETVKRVAKEMMDQIEKATRETGAYHPYKYVNYAAFWQAPMKSYGKEALQRMEDVSQKYDCHGLFQKQALGFKL